MSCRDHNGGVIRSLLFNFPVGWNQRLDQPAPAGGGGWRLAFVSKTRNRNGSSAVGFRRGAAGHRAVIHRSFPVAGPVAIDRGRAADCADGSGPGSGSTVGQAAGWDCAGFGGPVYGLGLVGRRPLVPKLVGRCSRAVDPADQLSPERVE